MFLPSVSWLASASSSSCCTGWAPAWRGRCALAAALLSTDSCISSTLSSAILPTSADCQDSIRNLAFTFSPKLSAGLARNKFLNLTSVCWPTVYLITLWNAVLLPIYLYFWQPHGGSKMTLKKLKLFSLADLFSPVGLLKHVILHEVFHVCACAKRKWQAPFHHC